ncbi:pantothenate transporter-2 [Coleophoma crateriformis]|uniref:Pantothenate transporter-2 n=1 Tax=Coleophoma crateriformis TaxID=565419 RepID=A0A3D8QI73_9HELO|nr:pantothenate transporter-2 [Coleophoma crateriformis]
MSFKDIPTTTIIQETRHNLHYAKRGQVLEDESFAAVHGFEAERMRARALLTTEQEKKLLRRIDWHIMPLCALMFLMKNLDANNVANIRIMNRGTDQNILTQLAMNSDDYNLIPYIIAEAPSNLFLKRLLPSRWLSRIMVSWGVVTCCHAAVRNSQGLYAARFFLGLMEAGMFPGVILQLCYWYRPDEMARRLLYFYMLGNFSTVISGVFAFAFNGVSGKGGLSGWQWMFLVEGLLTIVTGEALFFLLPDFPSQAIWLTADEKAFIEARLPGNSLNPEKRISIWREIVEVMKDVKTWLFTFCWAFFTVGTTGLQFYLPTVIADLGFTTIARSQLLNIPTAILTISFIVFGIWADTARIPRPLFPLAFMIIILACYSVLVTFPNTGGVYAASILATSLASSWYPMMWPWRVQTTSKATGSAFSIGFVNSYGQIGSAIGPQIFRSKYAPRYQTSFGVAMAMVGMAILTNLTTWWVTNDVEIETRKLKRARLEASKRGEIVLDEVDFDGSHGAAKDVSGIQNLEHGTTSGASINVVGSIRRGSVFYQQITTLKKA